MLESAVYATRQALNFSVVREALFHPLESLCNLF